MQLTVTREELESLRDRAVELATAAAGVRAVETRGSIKATAGDGRVFRIDLGEGASIVRAHDVELDLHTKDCLNRGVKDLRKIESTAPGAENYFCEVERWIAAGDNAMKRWDTMRVAPALAHIEEARALIDIESYATIHAATAHQAAYRLVKRYSRGFLNVKLSIQANGWKTPGERYRSFRDFLVAIRDEPPWSEDKLIAKIHNEFVMATKGMRNGKVPDPAPPELEPPCILRIDEASGTVFLHGNPIPTTVDQKQILKKLIEARGEFVQLSQMGFSKDSRPGKTIDAMDPRLLAVIDPPKERRGCTRGRRLTVFDRHQEHQTPI